MVPFLVRRGQVVLCLHQGIFRATILRSFAVWVEVDSEQPAEGCYLSGLSLVKERKKNRFWNRKCYARRTRLPTGLAHYHQKLTLERAR